MKYLDKLIAFALIVMLPVIGCNTDELQDLNINPQAVNQIDLNFLFTNAELGIASGGGSGDNRYTDWRTNMGVGSTAIQQLATTSSGGPSQAVGDKYIGGFEADHAPFFWFYNHELKNCAEIIKQTGPGGYDEGNKNNLRQAARIIRAFTYARLTDFYGSIPYSEANQGIEGVFFPKYDKQRAIYTDILKELGEASAALSASDLDQGFSYADIIFDGDISKWKKWGYSLLLRYAMRVSNVESSLANQYVSAAVSGGVMTGNDDNVIVPMALGPGEWTNQNGISRAMFPGDGGAGNSYFLSETFVNWLKGDDPNSIADDDPRLMIYSGGIGEWSAASYTPITTDPLDQLGLPNGLNSSDVDNMFGMGTVNQRTFSRINVLMLDDDDPYVIMSYPEVAFLLAEALERGIGSGISGTARSHYESGVRASMQMWSIFDPSLTVSDAEVDAYLATYVYGVHKPAMTMIFEQMWASKWFNWWDAWQDWKRTGIPALVPTNYPGNETGGTSPRRLRYPNTEPGGNPNFLATATLPDLYTTRVWWDGGPE